MASSSVAARAQASAADSSQRVLAGTPVARPQSELPLVAPGSPAPPQTILGSERLGVSQPSVSRTAATREPLALFRPAGLRHRGPGVALMIVGAAGVVTGLLINESVITVVGAGVGLFGLYLYLR